MRLPIFLLSAFCLLVITTTAQTDKALTEKPGTFEILGRTDYATTGGYTKAEMAGNLERIKNLVALVRQNPVLSDIKGFNGRARIHDISSTSKCGYGVPARVSFEFCSFFRNKAGNIVFNTIEPPCWSVYINSINGTAISSVGFDSGKCMFAVPLNKKTLAPGIDVYDGEFFVIYDPSRPDYWIPVTVNEAFASAREFAAKEKDEYTFALNKQFLDKEWDEIPVADRDKPAYYGGNLSRVSSSPGYGGQDSLFPRIVKVNPAYWNKSLPKSAIQFITLHSVQNKDYLSKELNECKGYWEKGSGSGCDLARFELSYSLDDIRKLAALIGK